MLYASKQLKQNYIHKNTCKKIQRKRKYKSRYENLTNLNYEQ